MGKIMNVRGMAVVAGLSAMLLAAGAVQATVTIDTVPVGDPGNAPDTRYSPASRGSVGYTYNIGKYEVTAGQYTAFLNAVAKTDTYGLYNRSMDMTLYSYAWGCNIQRAGLSGSYSYSVAADWANRPVNYVSWGDAARFTNWLHNGQPTGAQSVSTTEDGAYYLNGVTDSTQLQAIARKASAKWAITSENEWYKAAYYKGGGTNAGYWSYPTQSDIAPSNVGADNYADPGNHANFTAWPTHIQTISSPYYRTNVGEFENSASAYGTFDQLGNVYEWGEAKSGSLRAIQGSAFNTDSLNLLPTGGITAAPPDNESYSIGFRVAEVPEPATMMVLVMGGLGMLVRRRNACK